MNFIIKTGIILAMMLSSLLGIAQSKSDRLYDMFSGKDGVSTLSFSKSAFKSFEVLMDDDTKKVIYKMKKISVLLYNEKKGKLSALNVYSRMKSELLGADYFEIEPNEINCIDCDIDLYDNFALYGRGSRYNMDEFHLIFFEDNTCMLLSFYGEITIDDLKEFGKFSHSTKNIITQ